MRFRIYAFTVSVFIVFVRTEGLNALKSLCLLTFAFTNVCVYNRLRVDGALVYFSSVCVTHILNRAFLAQGTEKTAI